MCDESGLSGTNERLRNLTIGDSSENNEEKSVLKNINIGELGLSPTENSDNSLEVISDTSEVTFDNVIGHLEDMLIDEEFQTLQNDFLEKYWEEFEDTEENKHSYMTIFNEYTNKVEDFIADYLKKRILNFDMDQFACELEQKKKTLEGEIFEVLLTISDFRAFKEIFLSYRAMKEGKTIDLSEFLTVSSVSS